MGEGKLCGCGLATKCDYKRNIKPATPTPACGYYGECVSQITVSNEEHGAAVVNAANKMR